MNEVMYYVDFTTHNGETGAWNYKQAKQYNDISAARKAYHEALATYIEYGKLDFVCVILWDMYGNKIDSEYWQKAEPEPNTEE